MHSTRKVWRKPTTSSLLRLVLLFAATSPLPAQDILRPAPPPSLLPPLLRKQEPPPPPSRPPAPPETPFKIGSVVLRPLLDYSYMNAEGLPSADTRRVASEIHTVMAGLSIDLGERWSLAYNPTWVNYTARAMTDTFDQSASLSGIVAFRDWGFQISQSYAQSTPTLIETGQQTKQETWTSSLGGAYIFNPSARLQASAGLNERYTDIATDTRAWSSTVTLNLTFSERLSLTVGPSFNYTEVIDAPDLYSETYSARFNWRPVDKVTLGINTGMQYSHSTSAAGVDLSHPTLNLTFGYQPFETTTLSFTADRTVTPSYFRDQVTDVFRWSVGLSQRLLGRFYFNASYAPYDTDYTATDTLTEAGRKDSVKSYSAGLTTQLFGRLTVAATFTQTDNNSNQSGFSFSTKQYGVQLGYRY